AKSANARLLSVEDARGPPEDSDSAKGRDKKDRKDSKRLTEKVLEDRIETDKSGKALETSREQVAAGTKTAADYAAEEAAHQKRVAKAEADRAKLSSKRVELVDEVVDGHESLGSREDALAAEAKQVAAGAVDSGTHGRNVAAYDADKKELYKKTDQLREATGTD